MDIDILKNIFPPKFYYPLRQQVPHDYHLAYKENGSQES